MCKNSDENANPMPAGAGKGAAAAIKSLIGISAVGNIIMSAISSYFQVKGEEENKRKIAVCDGINLILTMVDFGLSCGVGYGIYSPMDSSNKRISGSDYERIIADTSDAAGKYSTIWIVKTAIALFIPSISVIKTIAVKESSEEEGGSDLLEKLDMVNSACSGIICLVSAFFEILACIEAGKVDGDKLTDSQKKDKSCFLCETVGFICDDACSVVDAIISIGDIKNIPIFVVRGVCEAAYAVSMFVEAGYINNN
ncbi:MAG: hypothetical protein NC320_00820 [Clostridium sp.]|nr:hypothetical protein [Clostridium sp.]MCM1546803.1 hypothetical protein [Ruminococcus sp.]